MAQTSPDPEAGFYQTVEIWMYPWGQWFDGRTWVLDPLEDFPSTNLERFRRQVYYAAKHYELAVRTRIRDGKLYIQAYEP